MRTDRSDSPTNLLSSSGPLIEMKLAPDSFAMAFATSVFPQPGGPYSSTPDGLSMPNHLCSFGVRIGCTTERTSSARASSSAPTSAHVTFGIVVNPSRIADGCTRFVAAFSSSNVTQKLLRSSDDGLSSSPAASSSRCFFRIATTHASFTSRFRSAPTYPGDMFASSQKSTSSESVMSFVRTFKIDMRSSTDGMPSAISRSKRPARRSAESIVSGRFVAPRTVTTLLCSRHARPSWSMLVRSCATMRFSISRCACSRFPAIVSISSMKMMDGATLIASWNSVRTLASLSPEMPCTISGADT
mmetsp:Transcript_12429/g.38673  ORF Transcript_12429/g.38673 Transcript_12429/m.38673 type:complete len:301 (-) Transcript_12429:556-1458(-)